MDDTTTIRALLSDGGIVPSNCSLLVVDDQPVNVQALYRIFQEEHEVLVATSGRQAIEMCHKHKPDLVLLDVIMPEMDGIETCRRLKADRESRDIPVIFVTSQDSPDEETRGLQVGAVDFISKPVNPAVVKARVGTHLVLKAQADALRSMAFIDGLTRLPNRRQLDVQLDVEWRAAQRDESSLAALMIDVDHFKRFNDRYGHPEGDACLKNVAAELQKTVRRPRDLVARYGGEEFACLLPDTALGSATRIGAGVVAAVQALGIPHEDSEDYRVVTISVGVAAIVPDETHMPADLLSVADHRLYRAKLKGRNTVESSS
jgi:diguanylate cyclase (GGDEF)-like protein